MYMSKLASIAEARNHLPALVRAAERGAPVVITRRGEPVAVLVSTAQWERTQNGDVDFWQRLQDFRRSVQPRDLPTRSAFQGLRSRSTGRAVKL